MQELEIIVALFTFGGAALTAVKIVRKHTVWYWNFAPMLVGMCTVLWAAKIVA
jgi:hypothetical protein